MVASFITTFFMSAFDGPAYRSIFFVSPIEVAQDLMIAAFRVLKDGELGDILGEPILQSKPIRAPSSTPPASKPGFLKRFIRRFIIGLPLVGASSAVHMLISLHMLAPVQWIARFRGSRSRRNSNSRDIAALIIVGLLVVGAVRALYKVYQFTEALTKRALLRAEDAILEVA
ncbi:hypothetical protein NLJ89_g2494 [Agrocybe chaxingu]|uniref:Uncharacterized protein n=1 Tax=Agrocybe chaxingu TaxID=84603 RepID=A0A9W8K7E2_9AGAR|nr:hypothetical protein NLJ89_g2494 [Agrocybe chaxingu]